MPKWITTAEAEQFLEQVWKDMTGCYSPAELRQMEREERENYNDNMRCAAWWCGSDTFVDYDGIVRKV